jgi:hypothetical protein
MPVRRWALIISWCGLLIAGLLPESAQRYSLNSRALNGPVVCTPPGVSKDDLPADIELDWQVVCDSGSPNLLKTKPAK